MSKFHQENPTQVAAIHRDNLQKNLQRRLDAARANSNEKLVRQLEAEAQYIR
jgi:hypothetical protein